VTGCATQGREGDRPFIEDDYIPLSALEHFGYCPRQCALIHVEQVFDENVFTLRGRAVHEHVDEPGTEEVEDVHTERALPLWSHRYGLTGKADIVEFHDGVPYPVDYKHGAKRAKPPDDLQLCGQALCLEEMLGVAVPTGAIYHFTSRRRREVLFTEALREKTLRTVKQVRATLREKQLPPAPNDARCPNCSLIEACMPEVLWQKGRLAYYLSNLYRPKEEEAHGRV
jgi:CRISPR-associated exonuclease Cas4